MEKLGRIVVPGHAVTGNRRQGGRRTTYTQDGRRIGDAGWEFVPIASDDRTRLAYAELVADERGQSAAGFLRRAVAWFQSMGIKPERVLSDNGACYRSRAHAAACRELGLKHSFTRPYRPTTNGKAERFIKTLTQRWARGASYANSSDRTRALPGWLTHYNFTRRHGALGHKPPAARLNELNNLAGNYT